MGFSLSMLNIYGYWLPGCGLRYQACIPAVGTLWLYLTDGVTGLPGCLMGRLSRIYSAFDLYNLRAPLFGKKTSIFFWRALFLHLSTLSLEHWAVWKHIQFMVDYEFIYYGLFDYMICTYMDLVIVMGVTLGGGRGTQLNLEGSGNSWFRLGFSGHHVSLIDTG